MWSICICNLRVMSSGVNHTKMVILCVKKMISAQPGGDKIFIGIAIRASINHNIY